MLGLGNSILTDDAIGLRVVSALRQQLATRADVSVCETEEMGLSLLDHVAGFEVLIIVDAVQTRGAPVAFLHDVDGTDLEALPTVSPHFVGIAETLALGRELGLDIPRRVKILAVEVQDPFTVGEALSPALERARPAILGRVLSAIDAVVRSLH